MTIARPLTGTPLVPVREAVISSFELAVPQARNSSPNTNPFKTSNQFQAVVLQRHRAVALARGPVDRVQHRGRGHADGRLADPAPGVATALDDDGLDLRHLRDAHRLVGIEV